MIGMCKIPLSQLVSGCSIHETYPIHAVDSNSEVGKLEVRVDIMPLEQAGDQNLFQKVVTDMVYSKEFEQEIVM